MRKLNQVLLVMGVLCMGIPSFAQTTLIQWPLDNTNGLSAIYNASNIDNATDFSRGNGIGSLSLSADGLTARGWSSDTIIGPVDYYEVCMTTKSGVALEVNTLHFDESRSIGGPKMYEIYWSIDGFSTSTRIDSTNLLASDIAVRSRNISTPGLSLCDGQQLCFRLYGYNASDPNGTWQIADSTFSVVGSIASVCTAPTNQAPILTLSPHSTTLDISMINGSGNARLIVLKEGSPVTGIPCSGNTFSGHTIFGMGDQINNGEYVVYAGTSTGAGLTSITVSNLSGGKTYHVAVFEYYSGSLCYLQSNPKRGSAITTCIVPDDIKNPLFSIANGEIVFSWSLPYCYDDILIVASTDSIIGTPSGNGSDYTPDTIYGDGSDAAMNFTGNEYPVYLGNGAEVTITGLLSNTSYFLKIFTRLETDWTSGVKIEISTSTGCAELNNDVVFINELHYQNIGVDEDEGVEIAGPTGVNLAVYKLHFYEKMSLTTCSHYKTVPLSGVIDNEGDTYGAVWFPIAGIVNSPGAIAIYNTLTNTLVQFLSYRSGNLTAIDGIANGETATLMNSAINNTTTVIAESPGQAVGQSLQLIGFGPCPSNSSHYWGVAGETMGKFNDNQDLPIELIDFIAQKLENKVFLRWTTATERNNDYFLVEKSLNGKDFISIGNIQGAGTTSTIQSYYLIDKSPAEGNNYYRLRQVDFDEQSSLSKIILVNFRSNNTGEFFVYPTITANQLNVSFLPIQDEKAKLDLIDLNGRIISSQYLQQGSKSLTLYTNELETGHYILRIQQNEQSKIARFMKM